jgi:site-specific recombinase XerC
LSIDQARLLVDKSDGDGLRNKRDFAMISILLGCGLRRAELSALNIDDIQIRQGHWAIVDMVGKGGHVRTVPMPGWVKDSVDQWLAAAGLKQGRLFRAVNRHGSCWGRRTPGTLPGMSFANAQSAWT